MAASRVIDGHAPPPPPPSHVISVTSCMLSSHGWEPPGWCEPGAAGTGSGGRVASTAAAGHAWV